ncbi:M85 family metallopeptidase [Paraburkholderia sp. J63]|uniref:M85 family metallopeptidase n=1 Tax=Paraburkholderia sp. J63 TaxID=2805434 RepID=UPI002ABE92C0|nr:M85 family metallopeptidase [Paraburkholderia sp. J63]
MSVSSVSSSDPYAAQNYSGEEDKTSEQTSSQQPENAPQSSGGSGDEAHVAADDHQDDASKATPSSDPANTSPSSSSGSGDSQAPADDNSHRDDVSKAAPSSSSTGTPQLSKEANGGDTLASANDGRQQIDVPEKAANAPSDNASPTRSDTGNHDQANQYSGVQNDKSSETRSGSAAGGVPQPTSEYSVPPRMPGGEGIQQGADSGSQNRLPEGTPSAVSGAAVGFGKSSADDGNVPGNPVAQGATLQKIEGSVPSQNFINSAGSNSADPKPLPESGSRPERDAVNAPKRTDDAFADYVVSQGQQTPLTGANLDAERWNVVQSVEQSLPYLADSYTAATIGRTLVDALDRSPTFRNMVSYGSNNDGGGLNQIIFSNLYESNPNYEGAPVRFSDMANYLRDHPGETMPIFASPLRSDQPHMGSGWGNVNIGVAPNENSENLPIWRDELIHELVHHLTGAKDPVGDERRNHVGPTEILAQRVMHELGYPVRLPSNYASLTREAQAFASDRAALRDAMERNAGYEQEFFQRLATISSAQPASRDFHEIGAPSPDGTHHNQTDGFTAQQPPGSLAQLQFDNNGTVTLFSFADSAPNGAPTGYQSAYAASGASWDTQGRFFQYGKPVDGNPHVRQFEFPDGSKVIASAHVPELTTSDLSKFEQTMTVTGASAGGAVVGFVTGGPVGAMVGGAAGAGGGAAIANTYPYDRIWQGYTFDYYNKGETKPFYTQYMYAWDTDWNRVGLLAKQHDASLWPDYADGNPDANWAWWKWKTGDAPVRT